MLLNALEGKPLPIYGDGRQSRDWLFGEDLCRAGLRSFEAGQGRGILQRRHRQRDRQ